ncbi:hypothetical protein BOQ63_000420 (plasmid) [Streptomyces viridifaciens]|nr:hypothetical protein BOQ63_000420 [Streptomyces viridifaciens]
MGWLIAEAWGRSMAFDTVEWLLEAVQGMLPEYGPHLSYYAALENPDDPSQWLD